MKGNGTRSPDAIIADIEAIRSEMDSTLLAIEEKLTPGQIVDQGLDYLRNSGGREFLSNLGTSVKMHPLPVTLVSVGLAWLMLTQQRDNRPGLTGRVDYDRAGIRTAPGEAPGGDYFSSTRETAAETAGDVRAKASELAGRASDAAAAARDKVADAMHAARDRASDTAQRTRDFASGTAQRARDAYARTADSARYQMDRARTGYRQLMQEQPLALAAIGVGVGALIAALAPRTRQEDEMMGAASDAMKQRAMEAGHDQLARAGETMRATLDDVREPSSTDIDRRTERGAGAHARAFTDTAPVDSTPQATSPAQGSVPPLTGANMARPTGQRGGPLDE